jgi:hypothetical protein
MKLYLKNFIFSGFVFGLIMGLLNGLEFGIKSGLLFGFVMSILSVTMHRQATRKYKDFGYDVSSVIQERKLKINTDSVDVFIACLNSLENIKNCKIIDKDKAKGTIHAKSGSTWQSFGEVLNINILPVDSKFVSVTIESKPKVSITLVDYGKNIKNIESIIDFLNNKIGNVY